MKNTFNLATLATTADLPSGFEELAPFNKALDAYKGELVELVFYSKKVVQILGTPRGVASSEIKKQWQGIVIPFDSAYESTSKSTLTKITTNGTSAAAALGLSLINDIRSGTKNREEIDALYQAFIYWTDIYSGEKENATLELVPNVNKNSAQSPFFTVLDKAM